MALLGARFEEKALTELLEATQRDVWTYLPWFEKQSRSYNLRWMLRLVEDTYCEAERMVLFHLYFRYYVAFIAGHSDDGDAHDDNAYRVTVQKIEVLARRGIHLGRLIGVNDETFDVEWAPICSRYNLNIWDMVEKFRRATLNE